MNKPNAMTDNDLIAVLGGGSGDDSLARDLGQYIGGVARGYAEHPFLSLVPVFGATLVTWYGVRAMMQ
jgi:hypothetical protein